MIDIKLIRENLKLVKDNIRKKKQDEKLKLIDEILEYDSQIKELKSKADTLRHRRNTLSEEINKAKKEKTDASALLIEAKNIPVKINEIEEELNSIEEKMMNNLRAIPNIMHESVPIGKDESENVETAKFGAIRTFDFEPKNHMELAQSLNIVDFETSAKTSGSKFYYLKGDLALLNQALIRFAIDKMVSKGFTYVETPLMLNGNIIRNVTDLNDITNQIYKIENEDLYLIGTSEHSLIGQYINSVIPEKSLPITQTSYSMCFRKEMGSHGISEKGLYRTHQFNKIEMIVICKPEDSMIFFEKLKNITIELFTELEIPIRILDICSGDLGDLKHKQVDIEAWSPITKEYYEVGSCSNLTDAQARRLGIKYTNGKEKYLANTLNNTAIATSRGMIAVLENNQNEDGSITIPDVLVKYMNGKVLIGRD